MTESSRNDAPLRVNRSPAQEVAVPKHQDLYRLSIDAVPVMTQGARAAADSEREMTVRQALRTCHKGLFWSLVFTTAIVMEGFDLALLSGFYAFTAFRVS